MQPDNYRQYVSSLAILFVSLFVGLPIWWKTTEVYRSSLPYEDIRSLASVQVPPVVTLRISLLAVDEKDDAATVLMPRLTQMLRSSRISHGGLQLEIQFAVDILRLSPKDSSLVNQAHQLKSTDAFLEWANGLLSSSQGHYIILVGHSDIKEPSAFIGHHRLALVEGRTDDPSFVTMVKNVVESVYGDTQCIHRILSNIGQSHEKVDADSMRQMKASQGYQISFTLINPNPAEIESNWDIETATEKILLPFLLQPGIASLGNFTINSQVFYYTDVKFQASPASLNGQGKAFNVLTTQLPVMISSVESKLGSQVSQLPSINFLVYIPRSKERPLYIVSSGDAKSPQEGFLVPQWGGVVICNTPPLAPSSPGKGPALVSVKMEELMPIFMQQLAVLLGVPTKVPSIKGVQFSRNIHGIPDWQLDLLITAKMVEGVSMATSSLLSLVELLDKVKNMVISDHIRDEVVSSLDDIHQCYWNSKDGNISSAYWNARSAMLSSEAAFFDPSILALLYFPDDQKYAIYIPLFLPISIPVLLSSLTALKWIIRSLKPEKAKSD